MAGRVVIAFQCNGSFQNLSRDVKCHSTRSATRSTMTFLHGNLFLTVVQARAAAATRPTSHRLLPCFCGGYAGPTDLTAKYYCTIRAGALGLCNSFGKEDELGMRQAYLQVPPSWCIRAPSRAGEQAKVLY